VTGACDVEARRRWMSVLAQARPGEIEEAWRALTVRPAYQVVREAEVGLVMVRARAGGTGGKFNLGEMAVSRCTVGLGSDATGHAYVAGRNLRHAEIAAVFDALLQDPARRELLDAGVIGPLEAAQRGRRHAAAARSEPTRVEFFTLVRGED
jgi:alpha-D-ribose 1-methylphosphonate 5-triphosphate synthase subunit PhnG